MLSLRMGLGAAIFLCIIGYSESSSKKYLSKEATINAILKGREQFRREQVDGANMGDISAESLNATTILEMMLMAYNKLEALNATDQAKLKNKAKTLATLLETSYQALVNNGQPSHCDKCLVIVKFLKAVTIQYTWDQVGEVAYNICVKFGPKKDPGLKVLPDNAEELCNVVWIQGPHVFAVLSDLGITSLVQCQYVNWCMPEPSTDTSVNTGGRTLPPGVKDKIPTLPLGATVTRPFFPLPTAILPTKIFPTGVLPSKRPLIRKRSLGADSEQRSPRGKSGSRRKRDLSNAIRVAYLTDIHLDLHYQEMAEPCVEQLTQIQERAENTLTDCGLPVCCTEGMGPGTSGDWGDYNCNLPYQTYQLFLRKAKTFNADFLLYGGDNPPHKVWTDTEWGQFNCTYAMIEGIKTILPGLPSYPNIGNHETYPTNLYYSELNATQELNQLFSQWWQPLSNFSQENVDTLSDWFYFAKEVKPGLVLLSFNSLYMYTDNWYISIENSVILEGKNHILKMQQFMVKTMEDAMSNGHKVILMGHVPPGNGAVIPGRWLTNFVLKYGDLIVLYVSGHTHQDDFRLIIDPTSGEAKAVSLVAPSMDTRTYHNPGMRLFYLDPVTFQPLDYDQYYLNLLTATSAAEPTIELEYQATEEYGIPDLSAASYADLAMRMNSDQALFNKVVTNYYTQIYTNGEECNTDACHNSWMCRVTNSNYDERSVCNSEGFFLTSPPTIPTVATAGCATSQCNHFVVTMMLMFLLNISNLS